MSLVVITFNSRIKNKNWNESKSENLYTQSTNPYRTQNRAYEKSGGLIKFLQEVKPGLLRRHRAHHFVVSVDRRELRYRRDIKVKPAVTAADVAGGPRSFRVRHATSVVIPFVVTPLVSAESLAWRKRLLTDRANVRLPASDRHGGCSRSWRRRLVISSGGMSLWHVFTVAGFVSAEGLVRRERLVADAALVAQRRLLSYYRHRRKRKKLTIAVASEEYKAESEILFFSEVVVVEIESWSFWSFTFGPLFDAMESWRILEHRRNRRS